MSLIVLIGSIYKTKENKNKIRSNSTANLRIILIKFP